MEGEQLKLSEEDSGPVSNIPHPQNDIAPEGGNTRPADGRWRDGICSWYNI